MDTPATIARFCSLVRARSRENAEAMRRVHDIPSSAVGLLRQELDSMVRVLFLLTCDLPTRGRLIEDAISGKKWEVRSKKGKMVKATDRMLVDRAGEMHGWAESVYLFGCGFIHLSNLHDHQTVDPFASLPKAERGNIVRFLRGYHPDYSAEIESFEDVMKCVPMVFGKIADNLSCYIDNLERGEPLEGPPAPSQGESSSGSGSTSLLS